jgi:hypothetical protein
LFNPKQARPQDGKVVGPEYFKSKDGQLVDLATPPTPANMPAPGGDTSGSTSLKTPAQGSGADVLGGVSTTIAPGRGKNTSSRREQASTSPNDDVYDRAGNYLGKRGDLEKAGKEQWRGDFSAEELENLNKAQKAEGTGSTEEAERIKAQQEKEMRGGIDTKEEAERIKAQQEKELARQRGKAGGSKKTPNPETDTGGTPVPKGILTGGAGRAPKSRSEAEAERRRQVTLPSDDQSRQRERVRAKPEDALKEGIRQRTDGRINPGAAAGTTSGTRAATPPGSGCTQVDCVQKEGSPGRGPNGGQPRTNR